MQPSLPHPPYGPNGQNAAYPQVGHQAQAHPAYTQPAPWPTAPPPAAALSAVWEPRPPRSKTDRRLRYTLTVLYFPFHVVLWLAITAFVVAYGLVMEVVCGILPFLERPVMNLVDRTLGVFPARPRWWTSWSELRREDDPAFHRERIEKQLRKQKPTQRTTLIWTHKYRCVGARGLLDIAAPHGWTLSEGAPARLREGIELSRTAG
ncbi:hypothetical protein ACGF7W_20090 [Streptomyces sp. NPDC048219]|uniref:hypothetical protein n=1 Tax=Streptomyces sp. NPDC048219 TaxID=3365517 RepID=UPI00371F271C